MTLALEKLEGYGGYCMVKIAWS